jgi:drug/metabolite transporter (DMT)-like permease
MPWLVYALISAVSAAATAILAKRGVEGVPSTLATALRTVVVLIFAWLMVFQAGEGRVEVKRRAIFPSWLNLAENVRGVYCRRDRGECPRGAGIWLFVIRPGCSTPWEYGRALPQSIEKTGKRSAGAQPS